jgi:outer membrane protein
MKYKSIFLILIFTAVSIQISGQTKMTLNEAISSALHQNTSLIKSVNNLSTSEAAIKNAYGNLIPSLSFSSGFNWQRASYNAGTTVINSFGQPLVLGASSSDTRNYNMALGGSVTLFDGLATPSNIEMTKTNLNSAKYDLEKLRQDVILQTVNLFVTVVNDEKLMNFQQEDLKYNDDLLSKINEMFGLKMVVKSDVYSQEYQTSNSKFTYLQDKNNFDKAKISLLNYLSLDVLKDYSFIMDSTYLSGALNYLDNPESAYQAALDNRSDYQSQLAKITSTQYQLTIAKSGLYPSLTGNYNLSTSSTTPAELFTSRDYSLGLSLNFPIFSHWNTNYSIQTAQIALKNVNEDLYALERQIKSDVKSALIDLQTAKLQLDVTNAALKSSKEAWMIKRDSYLIGTATFIDQQQAYSSYIQAANNAVVAESNYIFKQFGLLSAVGLLNMN